MPQVKKEEVRDRILEAAGRLFETTGYAGTTIKQIAREAGISTANIYVYFGSKLDILFALYGPWQQEQLDRLEVEIAAIATPRERLRHVLTALWDTIPAANNNFANNLMQALTTATADDGYSRAMLRAAEDRISRLIRAALPADRSALTDQDALSHVLFMAFDGFAMNRRLVGRSRRLDLCIEVMADLLLGEAGGDPPAGSIR